MTSEMPSTSTGKRSQRLTKSQALDLLQRLLDEEASESDDSDQTFSDSDVVDDVQCEQPVRSCAKTKGKGKRQAQKSRTI